MTMTRRTAALALGGLTGFRFGPALAENLTKILVGFPAGGSVDVTARRIADSWRVQGKSGAVVVENRTGAGGQLAAIALKTAAADGTSLLLSPASIMTIYPHVYRKIQYDAAKDVLPVTAICNFTCCFAIGPKVPANVSTLAQFLDWAKANPGDAGYASPAAGAGPHFLGTLLARASGLNLFHVPYRGAAPGLQDLIGGQVAAGMFVLGDYLPYVQGGKLRLLGVAAPERSRFAPNVPTFAELGFKDVTAIESYGLFLPARTPQAIVDQYYDMARAALNDPAVIDGMARIGFEPVLSARNAYPEQLARERARWEPVVKASGFSIDG